ncbi:MAG TPA: pyridoxamine 5'-phosphate oxidase [Gammaproteobacteria bacterium]|nr:pyridoxamine 5'-phosphate oxidase [Gammaproteobacteria bacterium]
MNEIYKEAVGRFSEWFALAREQSVNEPTAMTLATVDADGRPAARTVLLKQFDERGFVFYTNTRSRKGMHVDANPYAALCFFWQGLMRQVLVEGEVRRVSDAEADAYWATRPRLSQVGAWASKQSSLLDARETMERRLAEYSEQYADATVPRPSHWTGYRIAPTMIEFWQSRPGRLHERERYWHDGESWKKSLIYP